MLTNIHPVKRVCSIRFILILRFMFGSYFDIHKSPVMRLLSKCYCIAITCLFSYIYYVNALDDNRIIVASVITERMLFTVTSLYNKEEYILDFFRYRSITDSLPFAKKTFKLMERLLILSGVFMIVFKMIAYYVYCIPFDYICYSWNPFPILSRTIQCMSLDVASLSFILVFALLYCRVNIIKNTLLKKGFTNSPRNRFRPRKYIQMYEAVLGSLDDLDKPLRFLIFSYLMACIPPMINGMFYSFTYFKEEGPTYTNALWLILTVQPLLALFISAILLDLTAEDLLDMKCFTLETCLGTKNEREHSELRQLVMLLEENPLQYNLCRVFPLSVKALLSFLSFTCTTIIAVLQIQKF